MTAPFDSSRRRSGVLAVFFAYLTLVWMGVLWVQGRPLERLGAGVSSRIGCAPTLTGGDLGVRSRATGATCDEAVQALAKSGCPSAPGLVEAAEACCMKEVLRRALELDFLFMPLYAVAFAFAARWTALRTWPGSPTGRAVAWVAALLAVAAALSDAVENVLLLRLIDARDRVAACWTPRPCQLKWGLLAVLMLFLLLAPVGRWLARSWPRTGEG